MSIIDLTEENNLDELEWIDRQMQLEEQMYNLQSHLIMCTARAEKVKTKGLIIKRTLETMLFNNVVKIVFLKLTSQG